MECWQLMCQTKNPTQKLIRKLLSFSFRCGTIYIIGWPGAAGNPQPEDQALQIIDKHPETATRQIAQQANVIYKTVWNIEGIHIVFQVFKIYNPILLASHAVLPMDVEKNSKQSQFCCHWQLFKTLPYELS